MTTLKTESFRSSRTRIVQPYELTRKLIIRPGDAGATLLNFFTERFPFIPQAVWQQRIENGWIHMDGKALSASFVLEPNKVLWHYSPSVKEPAVPDDIRILEEHEDWLIVFKPAPMPMHQGGRYYKNTLTWILNDMGYHNLKLVHRLDAVTSGLILFARNRKTATLLQALFTENRVDKFYYALVNGRPEKETMMIDEKIRRKNGFVFECGNHLEGGKTAQTEIEFVCEAGKNSIVKCCPVTGRTHQIRLHLQAAGHPIVDDPIYGVNGDTSGKRLQNCSIKLQSSGLAVKELGIKKEIDIPSGWNELTF